MSEKSTTTKLIQLDKVNFDFTYQRAPMKHASKIAQNFNPAAVGCILLGERADGSFWGIDGQQRIAAMLSIGIHRWECEVITSSGPEYEAAIYTIVNGGAGTTKGLRQRDIFKAKLIAKDPIALAVKATVESVGLRIPPTSGHGWPDLQCHERLMRLAARKSGIINLKSALEVIIAAWPEDSRGLEGVMINAMVRAIELGADPNKLATKLQKTNPLVIIQKAMAMGNRNSVHYHYYEIAKRYNANLKTNRLPELIDD